MDPSRVVCVSFLSPVLLISFVDLGFGHRDGSASLHIAIAGFEAGRFDSNDDDCRMVRGEPDRVTQRAPKSCAGSDVMIRRHYADHGLTSEPPRYDRGPVR